MVAQRVTENERAPLRAASCQAPNAEYIFAAVVDYLNARLVESGAPGVQLLQDATWQERYARLGAGGLEVAWICGAPYVRRRDAGEALQLLAAPVWRAPRYGDAPRYFSDMVVRVDHPAQSLAELEGLHLGVNEPGSWSGYEVVRAVLAEIGRRDGYFGRVTQTGSHQLSLHAVLAGAIDTAAIDSTVLEEEVRRRPELAEQLRVVHTLSPAPMPPWVAGAHVPAEVAQLLGALLVQMESTPDGRRLLAQTPLARFAAVDDRAYDGLRRKLAAAEAVVLAAGEKKGSS